jgi:hypothetical protein
MFSQVPGGGAMMDGEAAERLGKIVTEHAEQQAELIVLRADKTRLEVELALARARIDQQSKDIVKVQGEVLAAVMIGVAEGRVHWNMQVSVAQPKEDPLRMERMAQAAMEYSHVPTMKGWDDPSPEAEQAREGWRNYMRFILAAADAPPEANTSSPVAAP